MSVKDLIFIFLWFLLLDCDIFALPLSTGRHEHHSGSHRRADQRAGFKYEKNNVNGSDVEAVEDTTNQTLRMFFAPSLSVPRTQFITKDFRQKVYGKLFTRRDDRPSHAGYTNDGDTCNLYNKNLEKVWGALSSYINTDQEAPDDMTLHNIVLLVSAYLEHHITIPKNITPHIARTGEFRKELRDAHDINETKDKDAKILAYHINVDQGPDEIISVIEQEVRPTSKKNDNCLEESQIKLRLKVEKEYEKYLDRSNCLYDEITKKRKTFDNMNFEDAKQFVNDWTRKRKAKCKLLAMETFYETMISIIKEYVDDLQCKTPT